jgi:hypothetical protein
VEKIQAYDSQIKTVGTHTLAGIISLVCVSLCLTKD